LRSSRAWCFSLPRCAAMAWFQVNCPTCDAALQVWLDVGTTSVRCSAPAVATPAPCAALFDVHVPQSFITSPNGQRSRRRLADWNPRAVTAYNKYMASEVPRVKLTLTAVVGRARERAAFARAAASWKSASSNPKNAQAVTVEGGAVGGVVDLATPTRRSRQDMQS
jgi:hypothetical protein